MAWLGFLVLFAAMRAGGGGTYTWAGLVAAAPRIVRVAIDPEAVFPDIDPGDQVWTADGRAGAGDTPRR